MLPVKQDLAIVPGDTYRDTVRLMQPTLVYHPIQSISGAPAVLDVPGHGLALDWPVWVRGVSGFAAINREPGRELPWLAERLSADSLRINPLSAAGGTPAGGQLVYRQPIDLAGCSAWMNFTDSAGNALFALKDDEGLAVDTFGLVTRALTPAQTERLTGAWRYSFGITFSDGAVTTYLTGGPAAGGCCNGC
jgi:hypothetical protein